MAACRWRVGRESSLMEPVLIIQLFGDSLPEKCAMTTEQEVAEWDYGKYEGMLTKDIRKEHPGWDIWTEG